MNKIKLIICATILAVTVVGCGESKTAGSQNNDSTDTITSPEKTESAKAERMTFVFTGDMMLGTDFPDESHGAYLPVDSGMHLLDDCRDIFLNADLACGNLEGVLGHGGTPKNCNNPKLCFTFRMPEYLVNVLTDAGFDYMNLANNHMMDFGRGGIEASMSNLDKAGIKYGGVRKDAPYSIIEKNGLKVGITGFSTSDACPSIHDYDEMKQMISEMREKCNIVVVAIHAGGEGAGYTHVLRKPEVFHGWPRGDVYKFAHTAIDAGADIIWGHGPHVLRGMELYKDRLIMYSLGNFCTPYRMGIVGVTGQAAIGEVTVSRDGRFESGKIHSFIQSRGLGPRNDDRNASAAQIRKLSREDFPESPLQISDDGQLSR